MSCNARRSPRRWAVLGVLLIAEEYVSGSKSRIKWFSYGFLMIFQT